MRGRGWLSNFSVGNQSPEAGLPLANAFRWDSGVQVHASHGILDLAGGITTGTLGNPRVGDDNGGRQFSARAAIKPTAGFMIGAVGGARAVRDPRRGQGGGRRRHVQPVHPDRLGHRPRIFAGLLPAALRSGRERLAGADPRPRRASICHCARWPPRPRGALQDPPGLYAAARLDHLGFSDITSGSQRESWEAPVTRIEVGGGYSLQRNLLLKLSLQRNTRAGGPSRTAHAGGGAAGVLVLMRTILDRRRRHQARPGVAASAGGGAHRPRRRDRNPGDAGAAAARRDASRRSAAPRAEHPRARRPAAGHHGRGTPSHRGRLRRPGPAAAGRVGPAPWSTSTAPRGAFEQDEPGRAVHGPARRDVRAARARDHHRHRGRLPEQRSHLSTTCSRCRRPRASTSAATPLGRSKSVRFDQPGIVRVFCDIHSHMNAFILVFGHPLLRDDRRPTGAIASTTCRRAPTPWSPGTKARRATHEAVADSAARGAAELDFHVR